MIYRLNRHNSLARNFTCQHSNLFKFIKGIINENIRDNALYIKLELGQEVPLYSSKNYEDKNTNLKNIRAHYDTSNVFLIF